MYPSGRPQMRDSQGMFVGTNDEDLAAYHARMKADRIHKRRSNGQRVRQARERLYGKQSHLVTVRRIGEAS